MTEGTVTSSVPDSAPAGRRKQKQRVRKRNINNKRNESKRQGGGSKNSNKKSSTTSGNNNNNSTVPPPPQIKITIRNIQNTDKFGSVRLVLEELVAKLMDACVEKKSNNQYVIELDRYAARCLITEEEKIIEHHLREKTRMEEAEKARVEEAKKKREEESKDVDKEEDAITNDNNKLDVILAPKIVSNLPTIIARPLYVVPPRKTSRRGERAGTVHVLLIGPKIEMEKPTASVHIAIEKKIEEEKDERHTSEIQLPHPATLEHESPEIIEADGDTTVIDSTSKPVSDVVAAVKEANYPRELAKGRLLLSNTIKSLSQLAAADSSTQELFSGCIVEQSMNGKTWKMFQDKSRPDRREGTIEGTIDYKIWLETIAKQKEELKARPKPVPGGGGTTTTEGAPKDDEQLDENGKPMSSLVQHLRLKNQDAKRKKTQKKKKEEIKGKKFSKKNKEGRSEGKKNRSRANKDGSSNKKKDTAAIAAKKAKRKKKAAAAKSKKGGGGGSKASTIKRPTALLKPKTSTTT
ncbi:hypothetical protein FRACYDRAFT_236107 [Fragilariopsis cylindrus CCMP1102]|uniref:Uncharacterized protein n=1 Tax=Fragilariopsis cylindrus CCMP1102 TaxID=635003 RepID=A0A1E7FPF5_9STRA|nr:hypothetical protein FRACYDRAFT_236107 [Fragilariopsis cylindrus CCMP1102]|eukprot:OEU20042.1 hypothetical protein FRACYDRAFT_236107 [Fragilariopsis cylindrus CCMP1102]